MTLIRYADPLMEGCLSHRAGGETLQCISIPLNPIANVAGPLGTFLCEGTDSGANASVERCRIVGIWLLPMHELEAFTNVWV